MTLNIENICYYLTNLRDMSDKSYDITSWQQAKKNRTEKLK